jgi:hypothetical protein
LTRELTSERLRGHAVVFDNPDSTVQAAKLLRTEGYHVAEAYTPFAVHGMDEALGMKETGLPWATFVTGGIGALLGMAVPIWMHAVDWPLNIGGKDFVAWPAIFPVAFEVTVLLAAFGTVGGLLYRSRLKPAMRVGLPSSQPTSSVTDNRFVLLVIEDDGSFTWKHFRERCYELGAEEVIEGWNVT